MGLKIWITRKAISLRLEICQSLSNLFSSTQKSDNRSSFSLVQYKINWSHTESNTCFPCRGILASVHQLIKPRCNLQESSRAASRTTSVSMIGVQSMTASTKLQSNPKHTSKERGRCAGENLPLVHFFHVHCDHIFDGGVDWENKSLGKKFVFIHFSKSCHSIIPHICHFFTLMHFRPKNA